MKATRSVRVPIKSVDPDTWALLRTLACEAARFGNQMLAGQYIKLRSDLDPLLQKKLQSTLFKTQNDILSGWARNGVMHRVKGYWRRSGKNVLAGRERLACFSADRVLSITADPTNNRGVLYEREGEHFVLFCRFQPGGGKGIRLVVNLDTPGTRKDWYINDAVENIWSGTWVPGVLNLRFDRARKKLDAIINYSKPAYDPINDKLTATLGPFDPESKSLPLRIDKSKLLRDYADRINRMLHMREHHPGIIRRQRRKYGRGPKRNNVYRRRARLLPSYKDWTQNYVHKWSNDIMKACVDNHITGLTILDLGDGELPWYQLKQQIEYKADDMEIEIIKPEPRDSTYRAKTSKINKRARLVKKSKEGTAAVRKLVRMVE